MHSSFPSRFRAARIAQGLTLAQAAAKCGVSRRLVAYWEAGERLPPPARAAYTEEGMLGALVARPMATEDGRTLRLG